MANHHRTRARLAATALALIGLGLSAALLVDSLRPEPAFCAADGCAAVRATRWARPLGIPMPALGLAFFAGALALAAAGPRARAARLVFGLAGGAAGAGLLAVQGAIIGDWCRLCVIVDTLAIANAALVVATSTSWSRPGRRALAATAALAALAVVVPLAALRSPESSAAAAPGRPEKTAGLPDVVAREQSVGVVTIVDFIDFECPFCRTFHDRLVEALERAELTGRVRTVRKMVPLPNHMGALAAAIAWCCADAQGRGDEMAEALLDADPSELTTEGCETLAAELGLDLPRYRRDASDPAIRRRIAEDIAAARGAGVRSLPTVYIGSEAFIGAGATVDELVAALRRAAA